MNEYTVTVKVQGELSPADVGALAYAAQGTANRLVESNRRGPKAACMSGGMDAPDDARKGRMFSCPTCFNEFGHPTYTSMTPSGKIRRHDGYMWPGGTQ